MKLISIVVPMYFEEKVVEACYRRLTSVARENNFNYEIIFINDGSTDRTMEILAYIAQKDKRVKVISFSRNFGHQIAITAGMDKAIGDAVVVIDADLQDPPELIPQMIKLWEAGYDVVYARRKKRQGETWFKLFTAKIFYRILNQLSSVAIPVDTGDFRLIDRKVVEALRKMPEQNRFVRGMVSWVGFKQTPIEYEREERLAGETKYPLKKMIKFALDGIISFSAKPLKMVQYLGLMTFLTAMAIFFFAALSKLLGLAVISVWVPIVAMIMLMGGIQLLAFGIMGEYMARIYDENKNRPLYIIEKEINLEEQYRKKVGLAVNRK